MSLSDQRRQQLVETLDTNDDGHYRVSQPIGGTAPAKVVVQSNGIEYTFSGFLKAESVSMAFPDVLLYEEVEITVVGDSS